ncbi:hypothetical protein GCM10020331_045930 [Ectobacillus funiculus]
MGRGACFKRGNEEAERSRENDYSQAIFFQGKTQMEVAEEIGISQAQVSRLEKSAIKQMNKTIQG